MKTTGSPPLRVALANDYEVVVRGLARMFDSYGDRIELVELDARQTVAQPVDIVLYDTFGTARGDADAITAILGAGHVGKVVVYGWEEEPELIDRIMADDASAFVSQGLSAERLVAALEAAHRARAHCGGAPARTGGRPRRLAGESRRADGP